MLMNDHRFLIKIEWAKNVDHKAGRFHWKDNFKNQFKKTSKLKMKNYIIGDCLIYGSDKCEVASCGHKKNEEQLE